MQEQIRFARLLSTEGFATDAFDGKIGKVFPFTQSSRQFHSEEDARLVYSVGTWGWPGEHYELLHD